MGDFVPEGEALHSVSVPEGEAPHGVSVPEGATTHDNNIPDASDKEVEKLRASTTDPLPIAPGEWQGQEINGMVDNELSDTGRLHRNVGNYKQGPAKIQRLSIDGEQ
jgi:hypothetical protein